LQILAFATLLIYLPSLYYGFFFIDDAEHILSNKYLNNTGLYSFLLPWLDSKIALSYNVWQFVNLIFGREIAAPYRAVNILLHLFNAFLVFGFCKSIIKKSFDKKISSACALVGALFFLVHPLQVESVVWISNLRGVLSTTFSLLFLSTFLEAEEPKSFNIVDANSRALLFFILSMFCKPSSALICIWAILLDFMLSNRSFKQVSKKSFVYPLILLLALLAYLKGMLNKSLLDLTLLERLSVSLTALLVNIKNLVFPFDLHIIYPYSLESSHKTFSVIAVVFTLLVILAILAVLYRFSKKSFIVLSGYLIIITVSIGIVPYDFQNLSIVADRFNYLPLVCISLGLAFIAAKFIKYKKAVMAALALLALVSVSRVYEWRSDSSLLASDMSLLNDKNLGAQTKWHLMTLYGNSLNGDKKYVEANEVFNKMIKMRPDSIEVYSYLFATLLKSGSTVELIRFLPRIDRIAESAYSGLFAYDLARAYTVVGDYEKAEHFYTIAKRDNPKVSSEIIDEKEYRETTINMSYERLINHFDRLDKTEELTLLLKLQGSEQK